MNVEVGVGVLVAVGVGVGVGEGVGVDVTQGMRAGIWMLRPADGDTGTMALSSANRASAVTVCCIKLHVWPMV